MGEQRKVQIIFVVLVLLTSMCLGVQGSTNAQYPPNAYSFTSLNNYFLGTAGSYLGWSVAMSAGPNNLTAVVGEPGIYSSQGGFKIYKQVAPGVPKFNFTQEFNATDPSYSDTPSGVGSTVAISGDGSVIVTGTDSYGTILIYADLGTGAFEFAQRIDAPNTSPDDFGASIAISTDANIMVVGAPGIDAVVGGIYIFQRTSPTIWAIQEPDTTVATPSTFTDSNQGTSVACDAACSTIIVGGPGDNKFKGAFWVLQRSTGATITSSVKVSGTSTNEYLGSAVGISPDGLTLLVTTLTPNILYYTRTSVSAQFVSVQSIYVPAAVISAFSNNVALTNSGIGTFGTPADVNGPNSNSIGSTWRSYVNGTLTGGYVASPFNPTPGLLGSDQGFSCACNADASICGIGAPNDNNKVGAIYFVGYASPPPGRNNNNYWSYLLALLTTVYVIAPLAGGVGYVLLGFLISVIYCRSKLRQNQTFVEMNQTTPPWAPKYGQVEPATEFKVNNPMVRNFPREPDV